MWLVAVCCVSICYRTGDVCFMHMYGVVDSVYTGHGVCESYIYVFFG